MRILLSLFLVAALSVAAPAKALVFEFVISGVDSVNGGTGEVTGRILGLEDVAGTQIADAVILDSVISGNGVSFDLSLLAQGRDATLWDNQGLNIFRVSGGEILAFGFQAQNLIGGGSTNFQDSLALRSSFQLLVVGNQGGPDFQVLAGSNFGGVGSVTFSQVAAVPLPGAFALLLAAIAGLGFVGRKRRASA